MPRALRRPSSGCQHVPRATTQHHPASDLHLNAAGSSRLLGPELAVANLDAVLSGASDATVAVSDTLAVQATGASVLHYRGAPQITRQQTSGASSIVRDPP